MQDFYQFAGDHPLLTWFLAWGLWPICWAISEILTSPFSYAYKAYARRLRSANIRERGWPQNRFMDADGDIVHPEKDTK